MLFTGNGHTGPVGPDSRRHVLEDRVSEHRGWLGRRLHRLTADDAEIEAEELQDHAEAVGAERVSACQARTEVCISGTIRSVTVSSRADAPTLEAEIYDGSGSITAVFLGRRSIRGIEAGRLVVIRGRLTNSQTQPTIYNPRYELLPDDASAA